VLSKWLSQAVLLGGHSAQVWRLDGCTANTAESLTVYGEILGVPVARAWNSEAKPGGLQYFDLPGVDWRDAGAVKKLSLRIQELGSPQVHLVLNAAYDIPLLLHQVRVFASCGVADLIFTHLDEETRWGKLWNLVAGTELPIRFLSAGQNVPGHFREATPELLLPS
jgi:flagellar biosynthesis protein FlhF